MLVQTESLFLPCEEEGIVLKVFVAASVEDSRFSRAPVTRTTSVEKAVRL